MITKEKIRIYNRYNGDGDMWLRSAKKSEKIINNLEWHLIENLINDVGLIEKGLTSQSYSEEIKKRLEENCDEEARLLIIKLAKNASD